jgi:hypothetical protein
LYLFENDPFLKKPWSQSSYAASDSIDGEFPSNSIHIETVVSSNRPPRPNNDHNSEHFRIIAKPEFVDNLRKIDMGC